MYILIKLSWDEHIEFMGKHSSYEECLNGFIGKMPNGYEMEEVDYGYFFKEKADLPNKTTLFTRKVDHFDIGLYDSFFILEYN